MINKNKYQVMCFLVINSMFIFEKQGWGWANLLALERKGRKK
jgi:hypothetical protein